ncbi:hypothetical protein mRhiFer1_007817 [Rhinolophus ferrumequinum]|uniref:G-protein coupled receptors family 1 profile domain-containing protein n=1 Tax=Rhinolophus ferrumequinum TaxID=59479 RepID=A0A7J8AUG4_RHIFE|nr:hypothetical protein mRhiFer1_007817 [Rhinolophus ferrumequinum]
MIMFLVGISSQLPTPMYFFLRNLSLLNLIFSTISYSSCFAQLTIRDLMALAECFLLAVMADDRFVATSDTLRYKVVISSRAVLRIHPTEARLKAFSTCGSHLVVVTIYFGTLIYIYVRPRTEKSQDGDKIISTIYAAVNPVLYPLICSLRNKDVEVTFRRVTGGAKP